MSNDYTDQMIEYILGISQAGAPAPLDDRDVAGAQRRMNLGQDWLSVQADTSNSALAGMGAFGPGAFDPTSTYSLVDQPGYQQLMAYAARPNTPQGVIAQGILQGSTASAEIAKLQAAYAAASTAGTLDTDPILSLIPLQPADFDHPDPAPDWGSLTEQMSGVEQAYMTDPTAGQTGAYYDPTTGDLINIGGNRRTVLDENGQPRLVDVETTPSEQAQWFLDQGLSLPTDEYTTQDLLGPDYQGSPDQTEMLRQQLMQLLDPTNPSVYEAPPTGKDQLTGAPGAGAWQKPGGPVTGTGFLEGQPLDLSTGRVEDRTGAGGGGGGVSGAPPVGSGSIVDMAAGAPAIGSWYENNIANPVASGIDTAADWSAERWQSALDALGSGWFRGGGDDGGPQGFGGGGGLAQLDPQTMQLIDQLTQQMTGGQPMMESSLMLGMPSDGTSPIPPPSPYNVPGGQQQNPDVSGPPMPGQQAQGAFPGTVNWGAQGPLPPPSDANTLAMIQQMLGVAPAPTPRTGPEPSESVPPTPGPNNPASRTNNNQTAYSTGSPVMQMGEVFQPPSGWTWTNGAWYDNQDRLMGYARTADLPPGASEPTPIQDPTQPLSENDMLPQSEQVGRGVYAGASDPFVPPVRRDTDQPTSRVEHNVPPAWQPNWIPWGDEQPLNSTKGPPPQPPYNPLPTGGGNWDAVNAQRQALQDALSQGAVSSGLGFVPQGGDANTLMAMAQQSAIQNPGSWWDRVTGGGVSTTKKTGPVRVRTAAQQRPQQAQQPQRNRRSGFASPSDSPARRQWFSDTQAVLDAQARDRRENYGYDYGRAAALSYLLRQQGIRPLDTQLAARRAAAGQLGV